MKALLLGDLSPTAVTNPLFEKGDIETLFTDTTSLFEGNDINFINLECALTTAEKEIQKFGPALKAHPNTAKVLAQLGVNYCSVSNNHFFDFGKAGALDTFKYLKAAGIIPTGFGDNYQDSRKDLVIEKNGEKIAIIGVCEHEYSYALEDRMGCRPICPFDTLEDIRKAKQTADRVIVIYHGGKEHCRYPSPRLLKQSRAMVKSGADLVLCQHSHCIGCYEQYQGGHILYGQGNFHFVKLFKNAPKSWDTQLAVKYDTLSNTVEFIPLENTENGITFAKEDSATEIMTSFEERNKELKNGEWKKGWNDFCRANMQNYLDVVRNACVTKSKLYDNHFFAHYLDCEAHTDVWRELFKTYNHTNEK